jgi:GNAT superfamily N-acetyltransferase
MLPDQILDDLSVDDRELRWRGYLSDATGSVRTLVAFADDEIVGFASLVLNSRDADAGPGTAEIAALYVEPLRWRTGAGRALLSEGFTRLSGTGASDVTLWVLERNRGALAFYARMGFVSDDTRKSSDQGAPEVRLRRSLAPADR